MVAVVGEDFRAEHRALLESRQVDTSGLETAPGKTFRWGGVYDKDLKDRETLFTDLNVFASFKPRLPDSYKDAPYLFLANIDPTLQLEVLSQCTGPRFVACDTMNFWIQGKREALLALLPKIDALFLNDTEAHELTGHRNLVLAAGWIEDHGPSTVVIKKGEHGALIFSRGQAFVTPAFLLGDVADPTGAGDSFAGGMVATLAHFDEVSTERLRLAAAVGTIAASFCVQAFGPRGLADLSRERLNQRLAEYRELTRIPGEEL